MTRCHRNDLMLFDHNLPERHQTSSSIITSPRPPVASMPSSTLSTKESRIVRGEAASDSSEVSGAWRGREGRNGTDQRREMDYPGNRLSVRERVKGNEERQWMEADWQDREREMSRNRGREQEARRRDSESGSGGERTPRGGRQDRSRDQRYRSSRDREYSEAPSLSQGEHERWSRDRPGVAPLW